MLRKMALDRRLSNMDFFFSSGSSSTIVELCQSLLLLFQQFNDRVASTNGNVLFAIWSGQIVVCWGFRVLSVVVVVVILVVVGRSRSRVVLVIGEVLIGACCVL